MKNWSKLLLLLNMVLLLACTTEKSGVDVKAFICPDLEQGQALVYEFENSNQRMYPIRYLLLERDSLVDNVYNYVFYSDNKKRVSGYKETRAKDFSILSHMLILELDSLAQNTYLHELADQKWEVPYRMEKDSIMVHKNEWPSKYFQGRSYRYESKRKLVDANGSFSFAGKAISTITIEAKEKTEVVKATETYTQTAGTTIKMIYGLNRGLVGMDIRFINGREVKLRLKEIVSKADFL